MSNDLHQFFIDYLQWYESGAKEDNRYDFQRTWGLCVTLDMWSNYSETLRIEIEELFINEELSAHYPFNHNDYGYFNEEDKTLNPARIAFVRKHAA